MSKMTYGIRPEDLSDVEKSAMAIIAHSKGDSLDGDIRAQKMSFLFSKTSGDEDLDDEFEYIPWDFGPYSENLYNGLQQLIQYGLVESKGKSTRYFLTNKGKELLMDIEKDAPELVSHAKDTLDTFDQFSTDDLVSMIYELYPTFTTRSLIASKVKLCHNADAIHIPLSKMKDGEHLVVTSRCGKRVTAELLGSKLILTEKD